MPPKFAPQTGDSSKVSPGGIPAPYSGDDILNWPLTNSIYPSQATDGAAVFTRSTIAWYIPAGSSTWTQAAVNEARFEDAGYLQEPARTNKCTNYNVIGADQVSSTDVLSGWDFTSGWTTAGTVSVDDADSFTSTGNGGVWKANLTAGKRYQVIIAGSTTAGSLEIHNDAGYGANLIGTGFGTYEFTSDSTATHQAAIYLRNVGSGTTDITTLEVVEIGGTETQGSNAGQFVSGLGTGAKAYHDGSTFQNPIPGMTLSGDVAAVLSIVTDATELASAGLDNICSSGKVYKLDNSDAAAGYAYLTFDGAVPNTNTQVPSVYARRTGGDFSGVYLQAEFATRAVFTVATYVRYSVAQTPDDDTKKSLLVVDDGDVVYFILNQLEEGSAVTSPIVLESGAATARVADDLQLPVADGTNFQQSEGMLFIDVTTGFAQADVGTVQQSFLNIRNDGLGIGYANNGTYQAYDGHSASNKASTWVSGSTYKLVTRWIVAGDLQVGVDGAMDASPASYDINGFTIGTNYRIGYNATEAFHLKNIRVLKVDKGASYAEAETA